MTDLLDLVLDAHGGLENWERVRTITARLSMRGIMLAAKQQPDGLHDAQLRIDAKRAFTMISSFPHRGSRGIFEAGTVRIENDEGLVTSEVDQPRRTFAGHDRTSPWSDLQFLYFVGYAYSNYFRMPFLLTLPGVTVREISPHEEHGETWRVLDVEFPSGLDVHCAHQRFYFNEKGLLVRNDYAPDVTPRNVSHYTYDHRLFDGFLFPTHRRVVLREDDGRTLLSAPSVFLIDVESIILDR